MSEQQNSNGQKNTGACLNVVIVGLLALIAFGVFGGALAGESALLQRSVTIYPHIPVDASTLNVQPSGAVFKEAPTPMPFVVVKKGQDVVVPFVVQQPACSVPSDWRLGVSPLPDCWESLTREEQNAIIRSH